MDINSLKCFIAVAEDIILLINREIELHSVPANIDRNCSAALRFGIAMLRAEWSL